MMKTLLTRTATALCIILFGCSHQPTTAEIQKGLETWVQVHLGRAQATRTNDGGFDFGHAPFGEQACKCGEPAERHL